MRFGFIGAALVALLSAACGAAPAGSEGTQQSTEPIAGGTLDTDHPAVFEEITHWTNTVSTCTANLIAPNVLLTARHCVATSNTENVVCSRSVFGDVVAGSSTVVTGDAVLRQTSTFYRGVDVRVPTTGDDMCGYDVALIILNTPVPAAKVTPLVPRIDRPVQPGESYTAVGYGVDENGQQNPGRMVLDNLSVDCVSDGCQAGLGVATTEFMGSTGICSGDSGGPALDADGKIIGIVSRGSDPCATPIYSEIAPWSDFITQTVIEAAASGGYEPPFWAYSGSSDAPADALQEGEHCTDSSECYPGLVCYYDGDRTNAACTAICSNSTQCSDAKQCALGYDVPGGGLCLDTTTASSSASASKLQGSNGCSVRPGSAPDGHSTRFLMLGAALALWRLRRTRRSGADRR
jgi:MYXO-CTERM domain-containing protein